MSTEGAREGRPKRVGVVVVHGVGESELGLAVNTLAQSLAETVPGYAVTPHSEVLRLKDEEARPPAIRAPGLDTETEFRVVRRTARHSDGIDVVFEGLHWADLTNLKAGRLNALLGLFRVIFESHHLVNAMLDKGKDVFTAVMRRFLMLASWLMRGPLAGLTIATSAICAVMMFGPVSGPIGEMAVSTKFQLIQAGLLVLALLAIVVVAGVRDVSWYDTVFWLALISAGLLAIDLTVGLPKAVATTPVISDTVGYHCFKPLEDLPPDRAAIVRSAYQGNLEVIRAAQAEGCYINGPYRVIAYGWRLWGALVLMAILLLGVISLRARNGGDRTLLAPAAASIGIVILQFMLWTLIVVTVIFPMLNRAEAVKDLLEVRGELMASKVNIRTGTIAKMMEFPAVDLDWIGRFKFVYGAAATTLVGFVLLSALIIARRTWIAHRNAADLRRAEERMPKLLFNRWLIGWLMLAVIAVILFIMTKTPTDHLFERVKTAMLLVASGAALLVPALLLERVSNGVHIARDLIDHHFNPRIETGTRLLPRYFGEKAKFPRRTRITARLESLMERLGRDGPFDALIFAGHSQGTVVIYEYVVQRIPFVNALARQKPSFLTFGSPIGRLYQSYFHEYDHEGTAPPLLLGRLKHWVNVYRVDDYVGGPIDAGGAIAIENVPTRAGGHMSYWSDPIVARELDGLIRSVQRG